MTLTPDDLSRKENETLVAGGEEPVVKAAEVVSEVEEPVAPEQTGDSVTFQEVASKGRDLISALRRLGVRGVQKKLSRGLDLLEEGLDTLAGDDRKKPPRRKD